MDKSNYSEYTGLISGGPSRESLFDSLRLGISAGFNFVFTDGKTRTLKAEVVAVKKDTPIVLSDFDNWIIELMIMSDKLKGKKKEYNLSLSLGRSLFDLPQSW